MDCLWVEFYLSVIFPDQNNYWPTGRLLKKSATLFEQHIFKSKKKAATKQ